MIERTACRTANATVDPRQLMGFSSRSSPNMPRIVETSQHSILASDIDATFGMTCLVAGFFSWPHCVYLPRRKSLEWRELEVDDISCKPARQGKKVAAEAQSPPKEVEGQGRNGYSHRGLEKNNQSTRWFSSIRRRSRRIEGIEAMEICRGGRYEE
ncbi:hypothetical protein KEM48_001031 [Puccinia striiformis f. sp. tritici PST-130]|uniref:Uncharacterized protein n=1 Tax=Puccinia striiformis f. sp. tritici PST-78 TaxID=1165861 RepID=A0A0L0V2A0_9BASI|nr:hypothetical protein Pst134EB_001705 [Puccinia striiformis f. sp. tritici]KAI9602080.1 hypothetical protein KEM48_001031 [Puccinia striiformis f. sp. tritici PST-130]KNE93420.1 hypothetical protein PSTG_13242 [Puccinia striiformis f. sp. tritici PST-78]